MISVRNNLNGISTIFHSLVQKITKFKVTIVAALTYADLKKKKK